MAKKSGRIAHKGASKTKGTGKAIGRAVHRNAKTGMFHPVDPKPPRTASRKHK